MSLFVLQGIRQVFGGQTVLDIEHLEMSAHKSYALQGPNGSGKSTLLQILALLEPPAQGELFFQGQRVDWRSKELYRLRRRIVLVDQHPIMFTVSVLSNVEYGLRMRGLSARKRRSNAEESLNRVGMLAFAHRPAHQLSGGETQRVAIARALACAPEVLLFDEPTASVDVENQAVIEAIIQDIRRELGISIIFATHKRWEAARLAEERINLFDGKVTGPGGENVLTTEIVKRPDRTVCRFGSQLEIAVPAGHPGPARVFIKQEGIRIYSQKQAVSSPENDTHPGRVLQMTVEGDYLKILVDLGVVVRALMTREDIARSGILVGDWVQVAIDSAAIEVVQQAG